MERCGMLRGVAMQLTGHKTKSVYRRDAITSEADLASGSVGIAAGVRRGEGVGLLREVISRFWRVVGPNGQLLFSYDPNRVDRFLWKVVRGIFALELGTGAVLPVEPPSGITLMHPRQTPEELE